MTIYFNSAGASRGLNYKEILQIRDPRTLRNVLTTEVLLQDIAPILNTPGLAPLPNVQENLQANVQDNIQNNAQPSSQPSLQLSPQVTPQTGIQSNAQTSNLSPLFIPEFYSSLLTKSDPLQNILQMLEKILPQAFQKESASLLLKINQQHPDLLLPSIDFLQQVPEQEKIKIYPKALQILQKIYEQVQNQLLNKSPPEGLGIKQEFVQDLRQIKYLAELLQKDPVFNNLKTAPLSLENFLDFVLLSKQEQQQHSTEELFALSVFLKAGFKLEEYILAAEHENPVKIALVLIEAQKEENANPQLTQFVQSKAFLNLVNELKGNLLEKDIFLQKLETFIQKLKPELPEIIPRNTPPNITQNRVQNSIPGNSKVRVLQEGFIESSSTQDEKIPLQALSTEDGLIPPAQWNIQTSANQIALQGSFLVLRQFPPGLNPLKLEVKNSRRKERSDFSIFALLTQSFLGEMDSEQEKESTTKNSFLINHYQLNPLEKEPNSLLLGALAFSLNAPVFLTEGFSGKKIPAPEYFEFYFLMDWIHPDKRYSRKDFLTLAESQESKKLRESLTQLNQEGLSAFEDYQIALKNFLKKIKENIPEAKASLKEAEVFLTQEVKKYLENKNPGPGKNQLLEAMPKGNLMASVLRKTASLCEEGQQFGEALIHFAEASKNNFSGVNKEDNPVAKLETLLHQLRVRFIERQNYASETWIKKMGMAQHFIERYQTL
ncbi:MAG: hypothetical protein HQM15_04965 [Deltaproteobacteria bacterium]|nr:hypothetical protein [Deltaproteobacteria bacterium]